MSDDLPACCYAPEDASLAHKLYAAYNAGGERPGLNYQNLPCPLWSDLPADVRRKWEAVADEVKAIAFPTSAHER